MDVVTYALSKRYADKHHFKGSLTTEDLNGIVKNGLYQCGGSTPNKPSDAGSGAAILIVDSFGNGETSSYVVQEYIDTTNQKSLWRRINRLGWFFGPWYKILVGDIPDGSLSSNIFADGAIPGKKLASNPLTKDDLPNNTDLNTITTECRRLGLSYNTYTNIPTEMSGKSFLLTVTVFGTYGDWRVQDIIEFRNPTVCFRRYIESGMFTPWQRLSISASGRPSALSSKKIAVFGDSIVAYGDYPARLGADLGATVYNVGFGGCRMAQHSDTLYDPFCMYKLADSIKNNTLSSLTSAADAITAAGGPSFHVNVSTLQGINFNTLDYAIIGYGTNDFGGNVPIGTNSDTTGATFKGAINVTVQKLQQTYPGVKLAFTAPLYRSRFLDGDGLESDSNPNGIGKYLIDYVDALKEVAALNHIPVLDMYRNSGINKYNAATYLSDGLHPVSVVGYQHIANKVGAFMTSTF